MKAIVKRLCENKGCNSSILEVFFLFTVSHCEFFVFCLFVSIKANLFLLNNSFAYAYYMCILVTFSQRWRQFIRIWKQADKAANRNTHANEKNNITIAFDNRWNSILAMQIYRKIASSINCWLSIRVRILWCKQFGKKLFHSI